MKRIRSVLFCGAEPIFNKTTHLFNGSGILSARLKLFAVGGLEMRHGEMVVMKLREASDALVF
jgi:hypothetical protein